MIVLAMPGAGMRSKSILNNVATRRPDLFSITVVFLHCAFSKIPQYVAKVKGKYRVP
jgi:hypothetical protein